MINWTAFDSFVRIAAVAAAFAVSACATARPASPPSPVKPAHAVPLAAAPAPQTPAPIAMPIGQLARVGGVVVSVDAARRSLTIKDYSGRTRTFRIADGARLTKGGDEAAVGLDDIAAGGRVRLKVGGDVAASAHMMVQPAQ